MVPQHCLGSTSTVVEGVYFPSHCPSASDSQVLFLSGSSRGWNRQVSGVCPRAAMTPQGQLDGQTETADYS